MLRAIFVGDVGVELSFAQARHESGCARSRKVPHLKQLKDERLVRVRIREDLLIVGHFAQFRYIVEPGRYVNVDRSTPQLSLH